MTIVSLGKLFLHLKGVMLFYSSLNTYFVNKLIFEIIILLTKATFIILINTVKTVIL